MIHVGKIDQGSEYLAAAVQQHLEVASAHLSRDYGGVMEHLWIELQMSPVEADKGPPRPFRFQRRVSIAGPAKRLTLPPPPADPTNVGHFSIQPDYFKLAEVPLDNVPVFLLELVYDESVVLEKKSRRLGGFDAKSFRRDLLEHIASIGRKTQEKLKNRASQPG